MPQRRPIQKVADNRHSIPVKKLGDNNDNRERTTMKTITAISWTNERVYQQIEVPWPEEGEERKPSLKPKDMGILEADLASPAPEPIIVETE